MLIHKLKTFFIPPSNKHRNTLKINLSLLSIFALSACSESQLDEAILTDIIVNQDEEIETVMAVEASELDDDLRLVITNLNIDQAINTDHLPDISEALPQLGMKLFYSKSLG